MTSGKPDWHYERGASPWKWGAKEHSCNEPLRRPFLRLFHFHRQPVLAVWSSERKVRPDDFQIHSRFHRNLRVNLDITDKAVIGLVEGVVPHD